VILLTFRVMIPLKKQADATEILTRTAERTRAEQGCVSCHFYSDVHDNRGFMLEEVWKTDDDLTRHLRSEIFRDVLFVADIALEEPEIRFSDIAPIGGMATIEKARSARK
jgi:quinol monooxygenase YgiN